MTTNIEHNFIADNVAQWEERVFIAACKSGYFTVIRPHRTGDDRRKEFPNFPEAGMEAMRGDRPMLYAVAKTGRAVLVPRDQWLKCLTIWKELEGGKTK